MLTLCTPQMPVFQMYIVTVTAFMLSAASNIQSVSQKVGMDNIFVRYTDILYVNFKNTDICENAAISASIRQTAPMCSTNIFFC